MSLDQNLADFFRPEERNRGEDLIDTVMISTASDTHVRAFVKTHRVLLTSENISEPTIAADCNCTTAGKGNLCKHIWAVLLKLESKGYDFLESKKVIEKSSSAPDPKKIEAQARQAEIKKQRSEANKARAKEIRRAQKQQSAPAFSYPTAVEEARHYFAQNGCPLEHPLDLEALNSAKKILSRVFHPDKGGSHAEILQLNENFEIVRDYLKS